MCVAARYIGAKSADESDCNQGEVSGIKGWWTFCQKLVLLCSSSRKIGIFSNRENCKNLAYWAQNSPVFQQRNLDWNGPLFYSAHDDEIYDGNRFLHLNIGISQIAEDFHSAQSLAEEFHPTKSWAELILPKNAKLAYGIFSIRPRVVKFNRFWGRVLFQIQLCL